MSMTRAVFVLFSLMVAACQAAVTTHTYTVTAAKQPINNTVFTVLEGVRNVDYCERFCDNLTVTAKGPCAGFTLLDAGGTYLCAFYRLMADLRPPQPPNRDLVAFYTQGPAGPAPAPAPPLPPPPPPPTPPPPSPRAPDNFLCTLFTDVGGGEPIVLNVTRALAPNGVDHFHWLVTVGFYNNSALLRVDPKVMVAWGVSGNSTLNHEYGHSPIANDPVKGSNTIGTLSFMTDPQFHLRATQLFLNFGNNSHLDSQGFAPFATVVGNGMATAKLIHNPTPNSTHGVSPSAYAANGNAWIRETYPGVNFITGAHLSA